MNLRTTASILSAAIALTSLAQTETTDTTEVQNLDEIVVEARNQRLGAEVSTYIPTAKQRNAAQTATDLLNRMAIPQIMVSPNDQVTDLAGKSIDIFIDYLPASQDDLRGMRTQDVKKVEYYDFPADPRFQGKAHVINFVMHKYEYGGYVKAYAWEKTSNTGEFTLYSKLQYRRMTFDIAAGYGYTNQNDIGTDTYETFRLPTSGSTDNTTTFERNSILDNGKRRRNTYWPTFKALYASDKITIQNIIGASFEHSPDNNRSGSVTYTPALYAPAEFSQQSSSRVNSLSYTGYWNFILNDNNTITFTPRYAYSHTNQAGTYTEGNAPAYYNAARDDSHQFRGDLAYSHRFGSSGTLKAMFQAIITSNNTGYHGTAETDDNAHTYRVGPSIQYSISRGKIYAMAGVGYLWDRQKYLDDAHDSAAPWVDFALQYSPNDNHSLRTEFHHMKSIPSSSYRSAVVIQSDPLISYTGNPDLESYGSYDIGISYSYIPTNTFSLSAYASTWIVDNRYVYDYTPTSTGILRTITQPGGGFSQWFYGANATLRLFNRTLHLTAQIGGTSVHNGDPYDLNKTKITYALRANYYLDNWYFAGTYYSPEGRAGGSTVGTWTDTKSYYSIAAGWSDATWNIQLQFTDFARWNRQSDRTVMRSRYYDRIDQSYTLNDRAYARLTVTYTFGFGKKVNRGNEATQQSGVTSGILR